jgi:hypothetical protein
MIGVTHHLNQYNDLHQRRDSDIIRYIGICRESLPDTDRSDERENRTPFRLSCISGSSFRNLLCLSNTLPSISFPP